jgi:hypothetical protein
MARIVLGLATSHSPQLSLPPEHWLRRGEEDRRNPSLYRVPDGKHVTFEELLAEAGPGIAQELKPEVFQKRYDANQQGIARLAEALERVSPDVLVILGDDQQEAFHDDNMPAFCVYWGEQVPYVPRHGGGTATLTTWAYPKEARQYPGHPALALHIIDSMMEQGFDVAHSKYLQEGQSITHAATFVFARIMQGMSIPVVPIMQNTYYPPNQPRPRRSYEFGTALRNAIETWKNQARVAIVGSGGLISWSMRSWIARSSRPSRKKISIPSRRCPWHVSNRAARRSGTGSPPRGRCNTWKWRSLTTCPVTVPRRERGVRWALPSGHRRP